MEDKIAVDESYQNDLGEDSDYGTGPESETTSLQSSVYEYVQENGRTYHKYQSGAYLLPNDEAEQDRLDIHHHIFLLLLDGKLCLAPVKNPQRILDVGTGTGVWALDAAEAWPEAEIIGTDLSPIQPRWVFPNCRFEEVDDAELQWTFPRNHFDYIHSRNLAQSIRDWPRYLSQMYRHTKPGGYVELAELSCDVTSDDDTIPANSGIRRYFDLWRDSARKAGLRVLDNDAYLLMSKELEDAGFVDVQVTPAKQPWNPWPRDSTLKHVRRCMLVNCETGMSAFSLALFTRYAYLSVKQATQVCDEVMKDIRNRSMHMYSYIFHVVGRKPN